MRVAIIGQSQFAGEVYKLLQKDGHKIAGVFTIPDVSGRADPLGMYKVERIEFWVKPLSLCDKPTNLKPVCCFPLQLNSPNQTELLFSSLKDGESRARLFRRFSSNTNR